MVFALVDSDLQIASSIHVNSLAVALRVLNAELITARVVVLNGSLMVKR